MSDLAIPSALTRLDADFGDAIVATHAHRGDATVYVKPARLVEVMTYLRDADGLKFDYLVDLCALDTLGLSPAQLAGLGVTPELNKRFHVVYHLRSMSTGQRLRVKAMVEPDDDGPEGASEGDDGAPPVIDSVTSLWKAANWAEREAYDMYGIHFRGHPDQRRILMYEEFRGWPLRKDYPKEKRQPLVRRDEFN